MSDQAELVSIRWRERLIEIEIKRLGWQRRDSPLIVFLHEGLGSVSMWRDFPAELCNATACRGLLMSRPGYGRSTARAPDDLLAPDFMHQQAIEVLPAVLDALDLKQPAWIFGHSDGGSIALIYGAHFPQRVAGLIVLAPHILVEDLSLTSIAQAREAYQHGVLADKLKRYHDDVDSAFWGWNRIWLDPTFKDWDIRSELSQIQCPVLAIQGLDDEYGTLAQIHGIAEALPHTTLLELADCGHSPHRDQPQQTIAAALQFMQHGSSQH